MAVLDHIPARPISLFHRVGAVISGFMSSYIEARGRAAEFEYYANLSDEQLAAQGLRRDQIAAHVFRDQMHWI